MKKAFPYILLALLAVAAVCIKRCRSHSAKAGADTVDRNKGLDRRASFLEFTEHANCRMQCIHASKEAITAILETGTVNEAKSETGARPCPVFALDGYTPQKQHLRVFFAQCDDKTKVMSCANLDSVLDCQCGGLGRKYDQ